MKIYRTYDGRLFDISQPLAQFQGRDDLFDAISLTTGIPSDDIICMTKTGQQINEDILDDMQDTSAGNKDDGAAEFYVFHRQFLYTDLEGLVAELEEMPELEAVVDEAEVAHPPTPRSLTSLLDWCDRLLENIVNHDGRSAERLDQLSIIQRSTTIALSNLLSHSSSVREAAVSLQSSASKELTRMQGLLNGHETDLKILSFVQINPKLLPAPDPSKGKPKERTLGDYVSPSKMGAVYQACNSVHNDLEENLRLLQYSETQMNEDTEGLRSEVHGTSIVPSQETYEESRQALARAREVHEFIKTNCMPDDQGWSAAAKLAEDDVLMRKVDEAAGEMILLDEVGRESLRRLTADKNDMVSRSLHLLGDISSLQSDYADLGVDLTRLDEEFKSNRVDGFRHLARLKNMLWAYGSTLIEIHRRSRFEAMFLNRGQALAEVMANLSESERRRRAEFRSQVLGALPWEIKGMEGNTSNLEISAGKDKQGEEIDIQQSDVDDLFLTLDAVRDKMVDKSSSDAVQEIKASLKLLMSRLDEAEAEFVKFVEIGLLGKPEDDSDSENEGYTQSKKANGNGSVVDKSKSDREMQELRLQHGERERALAEAHDLEMAALQAELSRLNSEHRHLETTLEHEKAQHEETRKQLESRVADAEVEAARRLNMEDEVSRLRRDVEDARRAEMELKAEVNEEIDRANDLEAHLHDLQVELEEAKEARNDASNRMEALLNKDSSAEKQLSLAQERIDELSNQLSQARVEERKAREAQYEIEVTRDKVLRNYRAEADGDRAILEENLRSQRVELEEIREKLRRKEREANEHSESVKNLQEQLSAAEGEQEQLLGRLEVSKEAKLEAEMAKRHAERSVDALVNSARPMMRRLVELHNTLRDAPLLVSSSSKSALKAANESESAPSDANADQEEVEMKKQKAMDAFQAAGDGADLDVVMELINSFTRSALVEQALSKLETLPQLCKKWIRAYKHSSEKSQKQLGLLREKITFRNFGIGDLALFLPTRNNSGKPWAAFNINYPHFFLNFTGSRENEQLRDLLQNKEWIVARILKIESRVATSSKGEEADAPSGNPFQLAEGVKFYLLDVEGWNNVNSNVTNLPRRKTTNASMTLAGDRSADSTSTPTAAPSLKRWDTNPQPGSARRDSSSQAVGELSDATPASPQVKKSDKEGVLMGPDAADLSKSSPVVSGAKDLGGDAPNVISSRASSPSGIALSLRNRSLSPEMNRMAARSANEIVEAGFTRWPTRQERQDQRVNSEVSSMKGQASPPKTEPSSENSSRRGADRATPAFGRRKKIALSSASGGYGTAMMHSRSAGGPLSPPLGQAKTSQQMMPIGMVKRNMEISHDLPEDSPNPFSASPAPRSGVAEMRDYFTARRATSSRLRPSPGEEEIDLPPNAVRGNTRRESSSSSIASILRPRSMQMSPQIRAAATLSPSTETAQGYHTLHLQPGSPGRGGIGSASDAPTIDRGTPTHADTMPRSTSNVSRRVLSSSSISSWAPTWSLGRRAGTKAVEEAAAPESSSSKARDSLLSASQSLRRLADGRE